MLSHSFRRWGFLLGLWALLSQAQAAESARFCIFDPAGKGGDLFALIQPYVAGQPGLTLKAYSDERLAVEDFKAGQCDGVAISTLRARQFNAFVGTLDAFGGLASIAELKTALTVLNKPQLAAHMVTGSYEVAGIVPLGSLYVAVRDRNINSVERAAGRRVVVLDWDRSQAELVRALAAQPIASDVSSYANKFNNGQVDILAAPALLYKQFELQKGLGREGAIYRFPLAQLTGTLLIRRDRFPEGFASRLRAQGLAHTDTSLARIAQAEAAIPARYWLGLSPDTEQRYRKLLAVAREQLRDEGFYDARMLTLLQHVRCRHQPAQAECAFAAN